jgi:hypothetical protein
MNTKHLVHTNRGNDLIIGKITVQELISAGLEFDDNFEISESFQGVDIPIVNNNLLHYICVRRSNGSYTNLEINIGLFSREDGSENVHIVQEVCFGGSDDELCFICPLDDDNWTECKELYLRADLPLFGSAKSLNIG